MSNKANWAVGKMGPRQKAKARARLPQVCAHCGTEQNLTLDHKLARAHGGTNSISNLQMLCLGCNFTKGQIEQQLSEAARQRGRESQLCGGGLLGAEIFFTQQQSIFWWVKDLAIIG